MCNGPHDFIPAPNVFRCILQFDQYGQKMANVFNVLSGGSNALADMDRIQLKLLDWLVNNWKPNASNTAACALMSLRDLTTENGIGKDYVVTPTAVGNFTQQGLPANVTLAIKWGTGFSGRSLRGRSYMVGLTSAWVASNAISVGNIATLQTAWTALLTKLGAGGTVDKLVIVSYCNGGNWRTNAVISPVSSCSIEANIDSQRRRLSGRGA